MKHWDKTFEYRRILEILNDYWLTEPNEDCVKVKMAFIKGGEFQTKHIIWRREPDKKKLNIEPVELSEALRIMTHIEKSLNDLVDKESEVLKIDKCEVWENIEHYADMYFVEQNVKGNLGESDDED